MSAPDDRSPSRARSLSRQRPRGGAGAGLLLVAAIGGVAVVQPRLADRAHKAKENEDVYAFPPPVQLHAATLGWDAAAVDLLWAKLLIEYGTHWAEHREFRDTSKYLDAILELEPNYWPVYRFADTMLAYRPMQGTEEDVRLARGYLERGTRERADDWRVWLEYGQFLSFIGPSFLHDDAERAAWRRDGANALGRAVDLGGDAEGALTAATLLSNNGARDQAIGYLRRAYAFTESMSEIHEAIGRRLASLETSAAVDRADAVFHVIDSRWKSELPFLTRGIYLLLGPVLPAARCVGRAAAGELGCARDWSTIARGAAADAVSGPESFEDSP